jgi:hypothetical protein
MVLILINDRKVKSIRVVSIYVVYNLRSSFPENERIQQESSKCAFDHRLYEANNRIMTFCSLTLDGRI